MIRRLGLACALVLAVSLAGPALASHTGAASEACAASSRTLPAAASDDPPACPDCGPACANGCCHAPHPATTAETMPTDPARLIARTGTGLQPTAPPAVRPAGPDRPPRA